MRRALTALAMVMVTVGVCAAPASATRRDDPYWVEISTRTAKLGADGSFKLKFTFSCEPLPDYGPFLWLYASQPFTGSTAWWDVPGDAIECDGEVHRATYRVSSFFEDPFVAGPIEVYASVEVAEDVETVMLR